MGEYDITLKILIMEAAGDLLQACGYHGEVAEWINVELPEVKSRSIDLISRMRSGEVIHFEIQSSHDSEMAERMLEYALAILRREKKYPHQILLYVGNGELRMKNSLEESKLSYGFDLIDLRDLNGADLLNANRLSANLLALLTGLQDKIGALRRIVAKIAALEVGARERAVRLLLLICGMRKLEIAAQQEMEKMPVDFDIMEHEVFGPLIRKGQAEGRVEGRAEGRLQGERELLRRQLERRFGPLPGWACEKLDSADERMLERLAVEVLDARSLEELFNHQEP